MGTRSEQVSAVRDRPGQLGSWIQGGLGRVPGPGLAVGRAWDEGGLTCDLGAGLLHERPLSGHAEI